MNIVENFNVEINKTKSIEASEADRNAAFYLCTVTGGIINS